MRASGGPGAAELGSIGPLRSVCARLLFPVFNGELRPPNEDVGSRGKDLWRQWREDGRDATTRSRKRQVVHEDREIDVKMLDI